MLAACRKAYGIRNYLNIIGKQYCKKVETAMDKGYFRLGFGISVAKEDYARNN